MAVAAPDYNTYLVTLTSAATKYNLYTLISAIDTGCPIRACELVLQADAANANPVLVGDTNLSATRYGYSMAASGVTTPLTFRHVKNTIELKSINLWGLTTAGMKVAVNIWTS